MKKYRFEIIIFIIDAICMIFELIASRLLSPYFGNSNIVWTSVIGIILLSSSLGNYFGGKLADNDNKHENLKLILIFVSIFIILIPFVQEGILNFIIQYFVSVKLGAVLATLFLFFVPSLFMGIITPIIIRLKLVDMKTAGEKTGKINAIATIGGITGTFLGGFVLLPNIGSISILFVLAIILAALIPLVNFKIKEKSTIFVLIIIIISLVSICIYRVNNNDIGNKILKGQDTRLCEL